MPPGPIGSGVQPIPVRYEKSKLLFFKSDFDDGAAGRTFAAGEVALVTVVRPEAGVYASGDGGRTWSFASGPYDFREVIFAAGHVYARGSTRLWRSEDAGRTWAAGLTLAGDDRLDAMALGADGALYASGRSQLYVSRDGARNFQTLNVQVPPQPAWRVRNLVPDPRHPHIVWISIRTEPKGDLLTRFRALLDLSSDEAVAAFKLVDAPEPPPAFGPPGDGVYLTQDGGGLWKKTPYAIDAWLAERDGVLYATAAEPVLQGAALMRRHPDLASAAELQFHGGGMTAAVLRAALPYPGREALLEGPVLGSVVYRSSDGGLKWTRLADPPLPVALALRSAIERGGQDLREIALRPREEPKPQEKEINLAPPPNPNRDQARPLQQRSGQARGLPRTPKSQPVEGARNRTLSAETLLSFLDPARLLARFNSGAPITAVSGQLDTAAAPTEQGWNALVEALAAESESEGEISLGPGRAQAPGELLHSSDGGASWSVAQPLPGGAPPSIAAAGGAILLVRRDGRAFRIAP